MSLLPTVVKPLVATCLAGVFVAGCAKLDRHLPDQRLEYRHQREAGENLALPPNMLAVQFDDALDIPPASGTMTYSDFVSERAQRRTTATRSTQGEVLPEVAGVELQRSGDQRWLNIQAPPAAVWPRVIDFWRQQGILLVEQNPAIGVIETDWIENRAEIRSDFVTRLMRRVADGLYATSNRDQFRVRIDQGRTSGTTELYLSHRGMQERLASTVLGDESRTIWEPSGSDPDTEALMLRRLMLHLGASSDQVNRQLATRRVERTAPAPVELISSDGTAMLMVPHSFRDAWRMVGLALDRAGFAVEDRDRSQGVFYVRYDAQSRAQAASRPGLLARLMRRDRQPQNAVENYQIRLEERAGSTQVSVHLGDGIADTSTAERILTLLRDELN